MCLSEGGGRAKVFWEFGACCSSLPNPDAFPCQSFGHAGVRAKGRRGSTGFCLISFTDCGYRWFGLVGLDKPAMP